MEITLPFGPPRPSPRESAGGGRVCCGAIGGCMLAACSYEAESVWESREQRGVQTSGGFGRMSRTTA